MSADGRASGGPAGGLAGGAAVAGAGAAPVRAGRARRSRRWILAGLALAAVLAMALSRGRRPGELPVYTLAAARLVAGEDIYRPTDAKPFSYPPFFALPSLPLLALPEALRAPAWYFISLVALGAGVALVLRRVRPALLAAGIDRGRPRLLFLALLAIITGELLTAPIQYASHDALLFFMLMLGVSAWAGGAPVRAGVFFGLGAAAKATPLLFLAVFIWQRAFRAAVALAATAALATLAPDVLVPRADGQLWVVAWYRAFIAPLNVGQPAEVEGVWRAGNYLNQSLAATIYRLLTPLPHARDNAPEGSLHASPPTVRLVTLLGQLSVLALLAWATRRLGETSVEPEARAVRRVAEAGAVCAAMLLLSPMSGRQHFAVLLVPVAVGLVYSLSRRSLVAGALLGVVLVLGTLADKDFVGRPIGNRLLAYGSLTACALAALVVAAWVLADRRWPMERDGSRPRPPP